MQKFVIYQCAMTVLLLIFLSLSGNVPWLISIAFSVCQVIVSIVAWIDIDDAKDSIFNLEESNEKHMDLIKMEANILEKMFKNEEDIWSVLSKQAAADILNRLEK